MIKIKDERFEYSNRNSQDMEIGDTGIIVGHPDYSSLLIMRSYSGFTCLSKPDLTWDTVFNVTVMPVDITIIITNSLERR